MKYKDYYKIMEVASYADKAEIKRAYHRLAHKFHPDISMDEDAEQRFKEINEAYDVLRNPDRRFVYDSANFKPTASNNFWLKAKIFIHTIIKPRAKTNKVGSADDKLNNKDNIMQSTQKIPLLLMGIFVLILSAITIIFLFTLEQVGQEYKQIQATILQGDEAALETLEAADIEIQQQVLADKNISKAVVDLYLQDTNKSIFSQLEVYEPNIENIILADNYSTLIANYKPKIKQDVEQDNFNEALALLDVFKNKYPNSQELTDLYTEIQTIKQQRLADLTKQYITCLEQTLEPLLDRIHCVAKTRQKIIQVGTSLPTDDLNLQAMYIEGINYALTEKDYQQVEKLLSEWQTILPNPSTQREQLQYTLSLHQQQKDIITDLSGYDKEKIIKRLNQLVTVQEVQQELFVIPEVQSNLLRYHIDEALELALLKEDIDINKKTIVLLEQLLAVARNDKRYLSNRTSIPWYNSTSTNSTNKPKIASLLQQCRKHFEANRLTTGGSETALSCYREVLKKDSGNLDAKAGLNAIEKRYESWAERALQQNKLNKVNSYLASLAKVNPNSEILANFKKRLTTVKPKDVKPKRVYVKPDVKPDVKPKRVDVKPDVKPKRVDVKPDVKPDVKVDVKPIPKPLPVVTKVEVKDKSCDECSCSKLLKQLSMGVKALTEVQEKFFQNKCH